MRKGCPHFRYGYGGEWKKGAMDGKEDERMTTSVMLAKRQSCGRRTGKDNEGGWIWW
jgi:hypothetical protein